MDIHHFVGVLEQLAPLQLAESWDNVGLLIEPPIGARIDRVLLTIDLTEAVFEEALNLGVQAIVAYHPPIFSGLKRLTQLTPTERLVLKLIRAGMAVYSPHTALDAVVGGVNDWLAEAFDVSLKQTIRPVLVATSKGSEISDATSKGAGDAKLHAGQGRVLELSSPLSASDAVARVKAHLGISHVRLAAAANSIRRVALCAGAGGSVIQGVNADLYLTGEMRHHDVLLANHNGTTVILTEHSNSERGYLTQLRALLESRAAGALEVLQSQVDRDPLSIV